MDSVDRESSDIANELSLEAIKKKAVRGVALLTGRTFILQAITLVATFFLTVFLDPEQFGVFFLVSAVINFFAYFSDVGLAAALIQKKDRLSEAELRTTFTLQQFLVISLIILIFLITPLIKSHYDLSQEAIYLLWALAVSLLLSSLKTIPSVLLERKLDFNKLILPQIVETVLYYSVAVYLAWYGFGIASFTVAVVVRSFAGLIVIYWLQPWKPGLAFAKDSLKGLLKYGVPYQANTFLAIIKDDGMTILLGGILGPAAIGLLGWAQKWGLSALRFVMDPVIKVTFPAFSRMQHEKEELSKAVSKSIFMICLFVFPMLVGLVLSAPLITEVIPKYEKWQPALLALSLISINAAWAAITTPLTNMLNAIGKVAITFRLMIMWTVLTWIFVPILSVYYGVNGAAAGFALVGSSSIIAIFIVAKYIKINFGQNVLKILLAAFLMGVVLFYTRNLVPQSFVGLMILVGSGVITYVVALFGIFGLKIITDFKMILSAFKA